MDSKTLQVFISYAHESPEFRQSVKELADYLRSRGICIITDHPYENRSPQGGWQAWMQRCVEDSDLVLVVCTPKYKSSFEKRDAHLPEGFGRTWEAAIELFKREQVDLGRAHALKSLGDLESYLGNMDRARGLYEEAIILCKKEQADLEYAGVLRALGELEMKLGNVKRVRSLLEESIILYEKEQSDWGYANVLVSLGNLETMLQNPSKSEECYKQALILFGKEQDVVGLINTCLQMARLTHASGPQGDEQATAKVWYTRSLHYAQQTHVQQYMDFVEGAGRQLFGTT